MATKTELIARLEELLQGDDPEAASEAVDTVKDAYEAILNAAEEAGQDQEGEEEPERDAPDPAAEASAEAPAVPIENAVPQDEDDKRFKLLLDTFHQRVNDVRRKRAQEEADNLAAKRAVMDEMKRLIAEEENIGSAFQRFKELQEQWKTIGNVPARDYRDLQSDYSHLLDDFFYNIRIYKELREHDLRKNTALKQALASDMESLAQEDNIKELEGKVREYQEKWHQVGPVSQDEWEALRDRFWNATRIVYDKVHEHYRARRAEHEANLAAKQGLVEKVRTLMDGLEAAGAKEWRALTDQVLELQGAWKQIGFATKKENEKVWREFREACNAFFAAKKSFFDELKDQYREVREKKQALLEEAEQLKDSTAWRQTADRLKALQAAWKEAGSAGPRDEHKLWSKFREACDGFFQARKAHFKEQDAAQAEHVKARNELIAEIEGFTLTGQRQADIDALKAFSQRWMECGRVSPRDYDKLNERYRAALDGQYDQLKLEAEERRQMRFQGHLEELKGAPDGKDRLDREQRIVRRKIQDMEQEMRQMEQNLGMFNFKSASGEQMRRDIEKRMERTKEEVERLKVQHRQLLKELR
ncbi:MAG TPA: DUF349 domain-containing protein [Flavobacteriales bacterium]|mgnify:CR=1 FL=1|nr:DUF349 domain-containing protein [Flavobacteriales bacterium]HPF67999.1 DUF349 domain-containing protein [Flavobacteriales bacterium]HPQ58630.1 DUF349 domain-containing protein [Flavobacteriales bacterium]HRW89946.1 DUF349 domain-containing protein [Flavobacteriales bacterium]